MPEVGGASVLLWAAVLLVLAWTLGAGFWVLTRRAAFDYHRVVIGTVVVMAIWTLVLFFERGRAPGPGELLAAAAILLLVGASQYFVARMLSSAFETRRVASPEDRRRLNAWGGTWPGPRGRVVITVVSVVALAVIGWLILTDLAAR
jgi:glucose dehydrogenase